MQKIFEYLAIGSAVAFAICLIALMFFYGLPSAAPQPPQQQLAEENKAAKSQGEAEKPFWEKATTDPVAAFTLFLVIFTAVLSAVGVIQLKMLTRAETVAEKTAQAAKDSADVAKTTLLTTNRPWLGLNGAIETITKLTFDENGATTSLRLPVSNSGSSIAIGVFSFARLVIGPWPPTGPNISSQGLRDVIDRNYAVHFSPAYISSMSRATGQLVLPGQSFNDNGKFDISEQRASFITKTADVETSAWIPITVGYQDQFGIPHATFFILLFETSAGNRTFHPIGTVEGKFTPFWMGSLAY
jgi:hypothetical protein